MIEQIRALRQTDTTFITRLSEMEQQYFISDALTVEQIVGIIDNEAEKIYVFLLDNVLVGYLYIHYVYTNRSVDIMKLCVDEQFRHRQIGTKLLTYMELQFTDVSDQFILEVRASNSGAICFYEGIGYKQIGRRKNFYQNPQEDANLLLKIIS